MRLHFDLEKNHINGHQIWFLSSEAQRDPAVRSPALATQYQDNQAVASDAHDEDERVDHRQEDPLKVGSHDVLHAARLIQINPQLPRARTRAGVIVVVHQDVLKGDVPSQRLKVDWTQILPSDQLLVTYSPRSRT